MAGEQTEVIGYEEPNAAQFHIELKGIEPKVWRRLVLPLSTNLAQLHYILQAAFGWTDSLAVPPEDVGGPGGYQEFLRVLFHPGEDEIEEQRHLKRWSGRRFNPERFDCAKIDKAVRDALRKRWHD